jgi:Fe-S cluster assembly protein SufD
MARSMENHDSSQATALATVEAAFEKLRTNSPTWLQPLQEKAFESFLGMGYPQPKDEDWKYTNLAPFAKRSTEYLHNQPTLNNDIIRTLIDDLPNIDNEIRVVFVNGLYRADLSTESEPENGIRLTPYSTADSSTAEQILHCQPTDQSAMIALNTAFMADGLAIHIADSNKCETPVHVLFASDGQPAAAHPRLSIDVGRNADALVVQHHIGTGKGLVNAVTSINCAENSRMFYVRLQNESTQSMHVANQVVRVAADGHFDSVSIDFGSLLARNDLDVDLHGERAVANLHGLFMANDDRHVDNHLRVDHHAVNTTSLENYRGILNDKARGVFNGKIIVHAGADGTDAQMSNRNLLLSGQSEVDTKPELEIYTDDVKCAHGSTTGQLDMNSMFYLRTRGIPELTARTMLVTAFAQEIINHVGSRAPALADYLGTLLNRQLPSNT